jgi:antitoxin component of MazEF toxin-antitoxin module
MKEQRKDNKRPELVPFGDGLIQTSRRIAIPDILLQNVDLQEGDAVELFFDRGDITGEKAIVVIKSKSPSKTKRRRKSEQNQHSLNKEVNDT